MTPAGFAAAMAIAASIWSPAARADAPVAADPLVCAPRIPAGRSFSDQVADKLTLLGDTVDAHLGRLTLDHIDFRFDGRARRARVRLRGETGQLSLRVDSDILFERGLARVDARIDLGIAGRHLHLDLPDFEMVPRSFNAEHYVEIHLPLLEGEF